MAMEEVRKRLMVETASSGLDKTASEINNVADAEARLTVESQKTERAALSQEAAFAKLERRYVDGVRQQQELAKVQTQVNAAVAQNPALQDRANVVLASASQRFAAVETASRKMIAGLSAAGDIGAVTGARLVAGMSEAGRVSSVAAKAVDGLAASHAGLSSQGQAAAHSVRSMVEGLLSGAPPTQVLTQQINHLSYAASGPQGLSGAFTEAGGIAASFGSWLTGLVTPARLAIGGVAAIGTTALVAAYEWDSAQKSIDRSLIGVGRRSGATREDVNKFAQAAGMLSRVRKN